MKKRYGVDIDPRTEAMATSGSSDAVDHILTAYANPGDKVLIPNPGYALYDDLVARHDLKAQYFDLKEENGYLPDFKKISKEHPDAKILILNYPHNPTGSFAPKETFDDAIKYAKKNGVLIIHDIDNSEITHTGEKPVGIMQSKGGKDVAFQVHTFSKAQSMPGLRVAFAVSNKEFIDNLLQAKYLSGGSVYTPVQSAAVEALKDSEHYIDKVNTIYRNRKNTAIAHLKELGSDAKPTDGTYYLWARVPGGFTSNEFYKYVLHKANVAFTPGTVFGKNGEGFVRIVMSADESIINKSFNKIKDAGIRFDTPKNKLSKETQEEIERISRGEINVKPKVQRDFEEYKLALTQRKNNLSTTLKGKGKEFKAFMPKEQSIKSIPSNIVKDGQTIYLQNIKEGKPLFGEISDIPIFSDDNKLKELHSEIKNQWLPTAPINSDADILPVYKSGTYYNDAHYFVLKTEDNKIQAVSNLEIQGDKCLWVRNLNSAPWNQGKDAEIKGCGTGLMARMASFCIETGNDTLKLATNKPENVIFYKKLGLNECGNRNIAGIDNTVLSFDKKGMQKFLDNYEQNLTC